MKGAKESLKTKIDVSQDHKFTHVQKAHSTRGWQVNLRFTKKKCRNCECKYNGDDFKEVASNLNTSNLIRCKGLVNVYLVKILVTTCCYEGRDCIQEGKMSIEKLSKGERRVWEERAVDEIIKFGTQIIVQRSEVGEKKQGRVEKRGKT